MGRLRRLTGLPNIDPKCRASTPPADGSRIIVWVTDADMPGSSQATGAAALHAGWSHGHRDVSGGWLRPTGFGGGDGLVINTTLIAGVGGGGVPGRAVAPPG